VRFIPRRFIAKAEFLEPPVSIPKPSNGTKKTRSGIISLTLSSSSASLKKKTGDTKFDAEVKKRLGTLFPRGMER